MAAGDEQVRVGILAYGLDRPPSGIGRYTIELVRALVTHRPDVSIFLLKPFDRSIPGLGGTDVDVLRLRGVRLLPALMSIGPAEIAAVALRHRLDVVHDPSGVSPFLVPRRLAPFARAVTIHDVIPFVHPETHARLTNLLFRRYIPQTLRFVDRLVTVSDASKQDIERFLPIGGHRVSRIYCGIGHQFRPQDPGAVDRALERHGIVRPYLLTVGALQARKNLETLFRAFARLRAEGFQHRLVVVGRKAWKAEGAFRQLDELGLNDAVTLTGYVADEDLPPLYAGADCFVFPSIYEGFGFPPLEAMACGVPVVVSRTSSLPEVVGEAGILVEPYAVDDVVSGIVRILGDSGLRETLARKGIERAALFDWRHAANAHADLYRELAEPYRRRNAI
jgi:glycosyltransferase involved in cell wall biosynthesis